MSSVSTAVAEQKRTGPLATMEQHRADLVLVLPSHINAESWYASTRAALSRSTDLMAAAQANPQSLIDALHEAARLGLQPGTEEYYLTPRKRKGQLEILGIAGYQGEVELIYRAGAVSSVKVELVRKNDVFRYSPGEHDRPQHEVEWFGERGDVVGAYAYAVMKDTGATSKVVVVDKARIERARQASASDGSTNSPWHTDYGAMVLKTAAHDLTKWVPTSAEYRREELRAARDVAAELPAAQRTASGGGAVGGAPTPAAIEGEVVEQASTSTPSGPALPTGDQKMSQQHQKRLFELLRADDGPDEGKDWASKVLGGQAIRTWASLTADQANTLIAKLEAGPPPGGWDAPETAEPAAGPAPAAAEDDDHAEEYAQLEAERDAAAQDAEGGA